MAVAKTTEVAGPNVQWFPLSCGCDLRNETTKGSGKGLIRCQHGRVIIVDPYVEGIKNSTSWALQERRTHLL